MKLCTGVSSAALVMIATLAGSPDVRADYKLTILHANDGENAFFESGAGFGGIGNFVSTMQSLRAAAGGEVISISAGDQILPGTALNASIDNGLPLWPAIGHFAAGFDAAVLGNHEFDLGTAVTADYLNSFALAPATSSPSGFAPPAGAKVPQFVSTNLDFSGDANLAPLFGAGNLIQSTAVINSGTKNIGIIGVTTPELPDITNPGGVSVLGSNPNDVGDAQAALDLAAIVNAAATDLRTNQGADHVIMAGHLQGLNFDSLVAGNLAGIDAIVAAGGGELQTDAGGHMLIPGDSPNSSFVFGQQVNGIPIVTTPGGYNYVGQLVLNFDDAGNLTGIDAASSGLKAVDGSAVTADPFTVEEVEDPIAAALAGGNVQIAVSEVDLDSRRSNGLPPGFGAQGERVAETNLGNLIADAIRDRVSDENVEFNLGITEPILGLMNGGGIRQDSDGNDTIIPAGPITEAVVDNQLPFSNNIGYITGVTAQRILDILENGVSQVENVDGRFPQISGFQFIYDPALPAGDRVLEIRLEDGTLIYDDATSFLASDTFTIGVFEFLAGGGDNFPLDDLTFNDLGILDSDMFKEFLINDLGGVITAEDYPFGGEGRIVAVPEPASLALIGLGGLTLLRRGRRAA